MATNRLVVKEEVAVYASVLFDAAHTAGGQEAVLEVREQMGEIIRLMRADLELTQSLSNPDFTPAQRKELVEGTFADCHLALREVLAGHGRARPGGPAAAGLRSRTASCWATSWAFAWST